MGKLLQINDLYEKTMDRMCMIPCQVAFLDCTYFDLVLAFFARATMQPIYIYALK